MASSNPTARKKQKREGWANFHGLGIFKVTPDKTEARNENIRRVKAEMYCEEIRFSYGAAAWA